MRTSSYRAIGTNILIEILFTIINSININNTFIMKLKYYHKQYLQEEEKIKM